MHPSGDEFSDSEPEVAPVVATNDAPKPIVPFSAVRGLLMPNVGACVSDVSSEASDTSSGRFNGYTSWSTPDSDKEPIQGVRKKKQRKRTSAGKGSDFI